MLPVSSWPPRAPGTDLSPFGAPRCVPSGFVLPKGAWVVRTGGASVVMCVRQAYADIWGRNPPVVPGTGVLPGQGNSPPPPGCIPPPPGAPTSWLPYDQMLECFRSWQRKTGNTDFAGPPVGRQPPNWFGSWTDQSSAISVTLIPAGQGGTVLADGQNVMISGSGAMIMRAYSV